MTLGQLLKQRATGFIPQSVYQNIILDCVATVCSSFRGYDKIVAAGATFTNEKLVSNFLYYLYLFPVEETACARFVCYI